MLNQLTALMAENNWDLLLFYGHSWRKDFFRYLLNANFSGPWAMASLDRSGEIQVSVSDPWDADLFPNRDVSVGLKPVSSPNTAVAGLELMETRQVEALGITPVSASAQVEELRRVKSPEELDCVGRAAALADRGFEYFAQVIEPGMAEYELVAEVEGFLKSNGAEDNFMLIASGGTEVTGMKPPTERRFQNGDQVTTELTPAM